MGSLSLDVEEALIQRGFYSKRYAYVGYGASGAYIATQQNSIWSDASDGVYFQKRYIFFKVVIKFFRKVWKIFNESISFVYFIT